MAKPLLLYSGIWDYTAERLVNLMTDVPENEDLEIYMNSTGGSVFAGWAIIGAMNKRSGKKYILVAGMAASMAAFMLLFADKREGLNSSQYLLHRADGYVESEEDQKWLDNINKDLRKQMEMRMNMEVFNEVTGVTMDEIFDPKKRINVLLDASQAKKIGLIDKVIKLEPKEAKAFNEQFVAFADFSDPTQGTDPQRSEPTKPIESNINPKKVVKMTLAELQAAHPELYAQIVTTATNAERDRVGSFMAFIEYDRENVIKAVNEGTAFTGKVMTEMTVKMTAQLQKTNLEADGKGEKPKTDAEILAAKTAKETELSDFEKEVEAGTKKIIS